MPKPELSIIMLTHNREGFIDRSIQSILNQTFTDFEFIIVDNGSSDKSGVIADQYAKKDARIRVLHIPESIIGIGRNAGLDVAQGRYIAFVDDDDYAYPGMMQFLHQMIIEEEAEIAVCGSVRTYNGEDRPYFVYDEKYVLNALEAAQEYLNRVLWNAPMPTKMFSRELFEQTRFREEGLYDDIRVGYRYFANAKKTVACGKVFYSFTEHPGNNSRAARSDSELSPDLLEEYFEAFHERTEYLSALHPEIEEAAKYSEWSYMLSMANKIDEHQIHACEQQFENISRILTENYDSMMNSPFLKPFERENMIRLFQKKSGENLV